jgi:hypothetical protein
MRRNLTVEIFDRAYGTRDGTKVAASFIGKHKQPPSDTLEAGRGFGEGSSRGESARALIRLQNGIC